MWQCLGLAAVTCVVALLVAVLLWLVIRHCRSRPTPAAATLHSGVHTVTDLPAFLQEHPHAIVLFHASWCSHCKKLLPTYKQVAASLSRPMGTMECDNAEDVIKQYNLRGFPTIIRFQQGKRVEDYHGDRSVPDLTQFCSKK